MERRRWTALGWTLLSLVLLGACAQLEQLGVMDPAGAPDHVEPNRSAIPGSFYPNWPALDGGVAPQSKREKGGTSDPFLWDTNSALGAATQQPTPTLSQDQAPAPSLDLNDSTLERQKTPERAELSTEPTPKTP
jgi:hypothetical protein